MRQIVFEIEAKEPGFLLRIDYDREHYFEDKNQIWQAIYEIAKYVDFNECIIYLNGLPMNSMAKLVLLFNSLE